MGSLLLIADYCNDLLPYFYHRLDRLRRLLASLLVEFDSWRLIFEAGNNRVERNHLHILALVASLALNRRCRDKLLRWILLLHLCQNTRFGNYNEGLAVTLAAVRKNTCRRTAIIGQISHFSSTLRVDNHFRLRIEFFKL